MHNIPLHLSYVATLPDYARFNSYLKILSVSSVVWYGILGFNLPLNTVQVISETGGPEQ